MSKNNGKVRCRICDHALEADRNYIYPIPPQMQVPTDNRLYSGTFVCKGECERIARALQSVAGILEGHEVSTDVVEMIAVKSLLGWIKHNTVGAK